MISPKTFRAFGRLRFVDGYRVEDRLAYEMKSGAVRLTKFVRWQIVKDARLVRTKSVNGVVWLFSKDAKVSEDVMKLLESYGIRTERWLY